MHIVDSQVHLWGPDTPDRPWPPGRAAQAQKPYPIDKETLLFQMDLAGVSRIVIVPPSWEGDRNELALEAARLYPDRFAVMGRIALEKPESRPLVDGWKRQQHGGYVRRGERGFERALQVCGFRDRRRHQVNPRGRTLLFGRWRGRMIV